MIAMAVTGTAAIADAQSGNGPDTALHVERDPTRCLTARALRARVRHWFTPSGETADLEVHVHAASEPRGFTIRRGGEVVAERRFDVLPARCANRIDAVALAIALALEHLAKEAAGETPTPAGAEPGQAQDDAGDAADETASGTPDAQPEQATPVQAQPPRTDEQPPSPGDEPPDEGGAVTRLRVHGAGAALLEVLPDPTLAFGAGVEVVLEPLSLGLTLLATPEQQARLGPGVTFTNLVAARLHGCAIQAVSLLDLEGCAGVAGGAAFARGEGYARNENATMGWIAPLLRAGVRFPRTGLVSVRLALEGVVNVWRPRLRVVRPVAMVSAQPPPSAAAGPIGGTAGLELSIAMP